MFDWVGARELELNLSKAILLTIVIVCVSISLNDCDGSYAYLDTDELYRRADTVVKGTVTDVSTSEDVRHYYLTAMIEVEEYIKNPLESKIVTVRSSERKMGEGVWYEDPALVNFSIGEKVVVYLEIVSSEFYTPVGASQGKFTLIGSTYFNYNADMWYEPKPLSFGIFILGIVGAVVLGIVYWKRRSLISNKFFNSRGRAAMRYIQWLR